MMKCETTTKILRSKKGFGRRAASTRLSRIWVVWRNQWRQRRISAAAKALKTLNCKDFPLDPFAIIRLRTLMQTRVYK